MSQVVEPKRFPWTIAQMGAWDFQADPYSIGLPLEDAAAILYDTALPEQIDRCRRQCDIARNSLITAAVNQPIGKPS